MRGLSSGYGRLTVAVTLFAILALITSNGLFGRAYAAVDIQTSANNFFGPDLLRVVVTDSSISNPGQTIIVNVTAVRGATTLGVSLPTVTQIGSTGAFEFYVTTSN